MSRKLDIEITSISAGTATWRAAGAREPKGVVDASLIGAAVVGTVFRAEIEQFMEGVEITSLAPPRVSSPQDPRNERIVLKAPERTGPDVEVHYAPKGRGGPRRDRRERTEESPRPRRDRPRSETSPRTRPRPTAEPETAVTHDTPRAPRRGVARAPRESSERRPPTRGGRPRTSESATRRTGPVAPPVTTAHRNAFLATLPSEQLPIAEELLRGGLPGVRRALEDQNRTAQAQGRALANEEAITRIAEELLGRANLAFWKDRASGAVSAGGQLRLRDLRAVVTSAKTVILDDEARTQLKELQTSLTTRVTALRNEWNDKLKRAIESGDVVGALELTVRTPEPTTRVSSEDAARIAALASGELTTSTDGARWRAVVTAAADSPIRRLIKPAGIPEDAESRALAVRHAGSIPEFAKLLGMKVPPPPTPTKPARRSPPVRSRRSS